MHDVLFRISDRFAIHSYGVMAMIGFLAALFVARWRARRAGLLPDEITYCLSHRKPGPFLAARFAAKEAVSKAFGTGIGAELGWQDIEIRRKESGEPFVILYAAGQKLLQARGGQRVLISLSHTQNYAAAVALLESADRSS